MSGEQFAEAGRLAEQYGSEVRLATDQNLVITGVPEDRIDDLLSEPLLERFSPTPGAFSRGVVACTGSEFCRFGSSRPRSGRSSGPARWTSASGTSARRP
jgi:ferredoxin-nitrite reductase